jgi:choline kinase
MIGMVLAAGPGSRLLPLTETIPKTLLPIDGELTILDQALANLRAVGLEDVVVVTGYAADAVRERTGELERRHGVNLELVYNDKALDWNNAYSLWLAREHFARGVMLVNGDTVHPASVEESLLEARGADVLIAIDDVKPLGDEEMKVLVAQDGALRRITKLMDADDAEGEYIGVTLIEPAAAEPLAEALEATFRRDTSLYYEDGYQEMVDRGGQVHCAPIGAVEWVEVDNHDDLARAREIGCRS